MQRDDDDNKAQAACIQQCLSMCVCGGAQSSHTTPFVPQYGTTTFKYIVF